ncbi:MAG: pyridoxal phosphate-dependent aminotransferase, partial [Spirochaetaceae bacterium]|nr:pyridoxal phosphate-dependent aminotransferase [Spirochaetaceae bacterium]
GALFALFQAWLDPFDEVLVPDPGFLAYPILARLSGAVSVPYPLGPDGSFDAGAFEASLAAHPFAKAAVMNHPANPTGAGATVQDFERASRACEAREVLLLSDEVYGELHLGSRPPSLADASSKGVVLGSLSKAWGAPGLRVGWAIADPEILAPARLVHNYMVTSLARPSQDAAIALLKASSEILPAARSELAARWAALSESLREELGISCELPSGAFYYWLPLPEAARADPTAFCLRVRDEGGVITVPGIAFGERGRGHARLSYAAAPDSIKEGVRRLAPFWR